MPTANIRLDELPFTIDNIPFGVIRTAEKPAPFCASAIDQYAIDLTEYARTSRLQQVLPSIPFVEIFSEPCLNAFAALPRAVREKTRALIQNDIRDNRLDERCLISLDRATMELPMKIAQFSDFYCSLEHCRNCTSMSAGAIAKNWFYAPSVYNGRASSILASPHPIRRPCGVYFQPGTDQVPVYGASQMLDYELEMGYFVSKPIPYGETLNIDDVEDHIFGFVLLNDWSSRDLQLFEMKPLGPFHGKGFGTSISPWVITLDALRPFRCAPKTCQDPAPFPHLRWRDSESAAIDVRLKVTLQRNGRIHPMASSNLKYLYWTPFQQLTHHASAMCGLATGDLVGTGTISGSATDESGAKTELGCLYEATQAGTTFVTLPGEEPFQYLQDGDQVVFEGYCENSAGAKLGFGQCTGTVLPARSTSDV